MRICKYCKKPILDENVWNPDREGNGYHHDCLCVMEFISRDRQIYNKGRADILDKIRSEIENDWQLKKYPSSPFSCGLRRAIEIIDKYKAESEGKDGNI